MTHKAQQQAQAHQVLRRTTSVLGSASGSSLAERALPSQPDTWACSSGCWSPFKALGLCSSRQGGDAERSWALTGACERHKDSRLRSKLQRACQGFTLARRRAQAGRARSEWTVGRRALADGQRAPDEKSTTDRQRSPVARGCSRLERHQLPLSNKQAASVGGLTSSHLVLLGASPWLTLRARAALSTFALWPQNISASRDGGKYAVRLSSSIHFARQRVKGGQPGCARQQQYQFSGKLLQSNGGEQRPMSTLSLGALEFASPVTPQAVGPCTTSG